MQKSSALNIVIKKTKDVKDAKIAHEILFAAFEPYQDLYTNKSFNATVVNTDTLRERIVSSDYDVLIAAYYDIKAGTVSVTPEDEQNLYLCSMAVSPDYSGKGIGFKLLHEAEQIVKDKKCNSITLETYHPLKHAVKLYEKFGFRRTGKDRDYYGVTIFEMKKIL